jgi:hypothetical protein
MIKLLGDLLLAVQIKRIARGQGEFGELGDSVESGEAKSLANSFAYGKIILWEDPSLR